MTELGIGMVGYAFMGAAHAHAWRSVSHFFDLPLRPRLVALCGRDAAKAAAAAAADRLGFAGTEPDYRALLARDDVQLIDICSPGDTHAEVALAALAAGKHVLCEKPLANTVAEAAAMARAAEDADARGVRSMVGFSYRRVPALAYARRLLAEGRLGTVRQLRASYLQDWLTDPKAPHTWRMTRERAGSGALGDLGSHLVDLARYLLDEPLTGVSALTETFTRERPLPGGGTAEVTVDDAAVFLARFASGALGSFEVSRVAAGRKNALRVEAFGSEGSLAFDLESLNELHWHDQSAPAELAGFRRILVTEPGHPYAGAWWPPGHGLGYEHTFTHQAADLLRDIAAGRRPSPSFAEGLAVQRVLDAVQRSAGSWTPIEED